MRFAGFVLLLVALLCGSAYLFIHNGHMVELRLAEDRIFHAPLAALLTGSFLIGAVGVFAAIGIRDSGRALARWRRRRLERRGERVEELLTEGRRLFWRGEPERARTILLRAWKARQTRDGLLTLVQACLAADHAGEARKVIEAAHDLLADDPEILCLLADVCRRIGDNSGAIAALERARARHPRAERILLGLRDLYLDAERWAEAAALQTSWLALHPRVTSPSEHTLLAGARYQAAMLVPGPAARLSALEDVLAQAPRFIPAAVSIGDELAAGGRAEEALRRWEMTLRLQPRAVLVDRIRRHSIDRTARDRLRNVLRKIRVEHMDGDAIHFHLAQLWLDDGRWDQAATEIDALGKRFQTTPAFHELRARLEEARGQVGEALQDFHAATGGHPPYSCSVCQRAESEWRARCPRCGNWDSHRAVVELVA